MTVITWALEFLTGLLSAILIIGSFNKKNNVDVIFIMFIIDIIFNFILIPSIYVFSDEVKKALVFAEEWYDTLTAYFSSNRVFSIANNNNNNEANEIQN